MNPKDKRFLLFDFDGTLVNSMESLTKIAGTVMARHFGIPPAEARRLYEKTSGLPFPQQLAALFPEEPALRENAARDFEKQKRSGYFSHIPFEDTHDTLRHLKRKGYAVVVSSNSEQDLVERLVAHLDIPCDLALGYRAHFAKGLPHFMYCMERLGGKAEEMVFVGDSLKDGERAFEGGVDFIGMEGIFSREDFLTRFPKIRVISKLAELKELF